jgi:hypothetical protein
MGIHTHTYIYICYIYVQTHSNVETVEVGTTQTHTYTQHSSSRQAAHRAVQRHGAGQLVAGARFQTHSITETLVEG